MKDASFLTLIGELWGVFCATMRWQYEIASNGAVIETEHKSAFVLVKDTSFLTLTGELWGVIKRRAVYIYFI